MNNWSGEHASIGPTRMAGLIYIKEEKTLFFV